MRVQADADGVRSVPFRLLEELYADRQMQDIWSSTATVSNWLRFEASLAGAEAVHGLLSDEEAHAIITACNESAIDYASLWDSARIVGYPILGLVRQVAQSLADGPNGRVHYGVTTQDVMDSGLALQLSASCDRLIALFVKLGSELRRLVHSHAMTAMPARTHAQHAVPTTFGAKMAVYLHQTAELIRGFEGVRTSTAIVSLFGAGGTSAALGAHSREIRRAVAESLDLGSVDIPGHVARGRIGQYAAQCAMASAISIRLAREVIDLSRNEIGEVAESGGYHRGASSTMPQKSNPIFAESIIGFSLAAQAEGMGLMRALEVSHERSSGEWQAEWILLPQLSEHTASAIALMVRLTSGMVVNAEAMNRNLHRDSSVIMSEALMMRLAPDLGRELAHDLVYEAARLAMADGRDLGEHCKGLMEDRHPGVRFDPVLDPTTYLGECQQICADALREWDDLCHRVGTLEVDGDTSA